MTNRSIRLLPLLLSMLIVPALNTRVLAQAADLPQTPECRAALAALSQEEDALVARGAATRPGVDTGPSKLLQRRRTAAQACLGTAAAAAVGAASAASSAGRRSPTPFPLPGVVRPGTAVPGFVRPQVSPAPGTAPIRQAPLVTLGACDALGCWASDGTRVQRLGPVLLGPRGYCTQTGTVLNCP